jgi:hypothetical protein
MCSFLYMWFSVPFRGLEDGFIYCIYVIIRCVHLLYIRDLVSSLVDLHHWWLRARNLFVTTYFDIYICMHDTYVWYTHTHTHTHTVTHTHTRTKTHTRTSHTHTHTQSQTRTHPQKHTLISHTHTHITYTDAHARTHTHRERERHTHNHTHTVTSARALRPKRICWRRRRMRASTARHSVTISQKFTDPVYLYTTDLVLT